jgi:hypothetical protein
MTLAIGSCSLICTVYRMTRDLYSTKDVAEVRKHLLAEQEGCDKLTGLPIPDGQAVLDHSHLTQFTRGVLHRQSNAALGKLEGVWTRYLSYWYPGTLADFLRQAADYIDQPDDKRYVHPGWLKRVTTDFRACTAAQQCCILDDMGLPDGKNSKERLELFSKHVKQKKLSYEQIKEIIKRSKD